MTTNNPLRNIPTLLVIFGATGDLVAKKIAPALFHLYNDGELPDHFRVVGVARQELSHDDFRARIGEGLVAKHHAAEADDISKFLALFTYEVLNFQTEEQYHALSKKLTAIDAEWGICTNKLFYLAVSPEYYPTIFSHLKSSHLTDPCSPEEGWTRVIVEKPFGKDAETAEKLDMTLASLLKEIQIYRIDHYLAKEMLQNIVAFRFSNNLFEMNWGKDLIESIHIRLWEAIGVEDRGGFYDGVGALRDVGQNHLLQMLALVTMEHPLAFESEAIRTKRAEILETLVPPTEEEIKNSTVRSQYEGYRSIKGVVPDSMTETYFKIPASLSHPKWKGVPITLESGKRMEKQVKEIEIAFRHTMPCLCPPGGEHYQNKLFIHIEPREGITINFWSKKPGRNRSMQGLEIEERKFDFSFRDNAGKRAQYTEEYEKLLLDCIAGDQTLFISSREVVAMWKFTDAITEAWQKNLVPLQTYKPNNL